MDSVIETQRKLHEEKERLIDTIVKEIISEKRTHKGKINSERRVKNLVDRYHNCTNQLEKIYKDEDRNRERELEAIAGPNEFAEYYSRLELLREVHKSNPDETAEPLSMEFQNMQKEMENPERIEREIVIFTDEEGYGRFLDLDTLYNEYFNLKKHQVDYIAYLDLLEKLYTLFKQASAGDVTGSRSGMMNFMGRAKHDAWSKFKGIDQEEAKKKYAELINFLAKKEAAASSSTTLDGLAPVNGLKVSKEGKVFKTTTNRPSKFKIPSLWNPAFINCKLAKSLSFHLSIGYYP